jgi:hypothetical protein
LLPVGFPTVVHPVRTMKSEVVSVSVTEGASVEAKAAPPAQSGSPPAPADDDNDFVKETPTASNRIDALPAAAEGDVAADPAQRGGPGTYRILRPATTDFVDPPVVPKTPAAPAGKRVVIGAARVRR